MSNLLLLHGALASKAQFDHIIPMLQDLQPEAISFSGHGGFSIPSRGYTFDQFASDILAYADEKKIGKLDIFGYSMGGYAALYFASRYPERVNRIFTLNVKFNWDPLTTAKERAMLDAEKLMEKVPGYANQLIMQHGLNLWKQVLGSTSDMMNALSQGLLLSDADYNKLEMPVLLGIGDRDKTSSIEETLAVYRKLKNALMWVLPETPHQFEKVDKEKLVAEMRRFFS